MNDQDKIADDLSTDESSSDQSQESSQLEEPKISGFDPGNRSILKEPSLYLSIAVILVASFMTLSSTPIMFWIVFLSISAVAVVLHFVAERSLFAAGNDYERLSAPWQGAFVLTFGAILPGLSLLAYSAYSLSSSHQSNYLEGLAKMVLLLVVPVFNFAVWSSVRKRYLIRPRLTGLMNGLALGLSASWTIIWLKCFLYSQSPVYCKFGWMFLLFSSPFMLFASVSLGIDLWRKTEPRIARIAGTFSILGVLLSLLFVFAPLLHSLLVQSLLTDARQGSARDRAKSISLLRNAATAEDLRPSDYPVNGLGLAELLINDRGLKGDSDADKNLYFNISGSPYNDIEPKLNNTNKSQAEQIIANPMVGPGIPGLSLAKSQLSGSIDGATLSSSIDWTLTFLNTSSEPQEARGEIALPAGAVVSSATVWIDGQPSQGVFASTASAKAGKKSNVGKDKANLLVTMSGLDRVLVQCSSVQTDGTEMKIRIGIKAPLSTRDYKHCSLNLPQFMETNFTLPKRHLVHLVSRDMFTANNIGIVTGNDKVGFTVDGIIKNRDSDEPLGVLSVQRPAQLAEFAILDSCLQKEQFITERLQEASTFVPRHLVIVIDSSLSLKSAVWQIKQALSIIPANLSPSVYFASEANTDKPKQGDIAVKTLKEAQAEIKPETFVGGQDNGPVLREALETAAETPDSVVVWIHGPQPIIENSAESQSLELIHKLHLYDLQIQAGPNSLLQSLKLKRLETMVSYESLSHTSTVAKDLQELFSSWKTGSRQAIIVRSLSKDCQKAKIVSDSISSGQITCLWAKEEVARLLTDGQNQKAQTLALRHHIVTPVTGVVVLEPRSEQVAKEPDSVTARRLFDSLMEMEELQRNANDFVSAEKTVRIAMPLCSTVASGPNSSLSKGGSRSSANSKAVALVCPPVDPPGPVGAASGSPGLVGAPVDPRFGQSNEVGQLSDYGYDRARDLVRALTMLSVLISIPVGVLLVRAKKRKSITRPTFMKGIALIIAVPLTIHLIGTYMINNFGGLGGGL